jgi:hypothetical protein
MAELSDAIKEAYNVAPADVVILHTIELRHPAIVDEQGSAMAIRVVRNYENPDRWLNLLGAEAEAACTGLSDEDRALVGLIARLEDDAPMNPGELVPFIALAFRFDLPPVEPGRTPEMSVAIDNVGQTLSKHLRAAATSGQAVKLTYRPYLTTDLQAPHFNPPITFNLIKPKVAGGRAEGRARLPKDLFTRAFPFRLFEAADWPGLQRSS